MYLFIHYFQHTLLLSLLLFGKLLYISIKIVNVTSFFYTLLFSTHIITVVEQIHVYGSLYENVPFPTLNV